MIDWISQYIDYVLHLDKHLVALIQFFGIWTYVILFAIVFLECGLILTPFLPGESLLFAVGSISALGVINVHWLFILLTIAAVSGGFVNYYTGMWLGERFIKTRLPKFTPYLDRAHKFYTKHGGKTILIARLIPIIRTFAPFVAGAANMRHATFAFYNISGGIAWIGVFLYLSYFFGNIPVIKEHFSYVIIGIVIVSVLPILIEFIRHRKRVKHES